MNKVIFAPAGGRKTQSIAELCNSGDSKEKLIVTFTTTGQKVIQARLWNNKNCDSKVEVIGWYGFLLNHFVEGKDPTLHKSGVERYFDKSGGVYSNNIGKLAYDIAIASNGSCISRLQGIYDKIYFDEVQDLGGNDLEIIKLLFESNIHIFAVGDVRQSVYTTSQSDRKHKKYKGLQKIKWFRKMESKGLCQIEEKTTTWRCNQEIIDFADSVLPKDLEFPPTKSLQTIKSGHDGVFLVSLKNLPLYHDIYKPEYYRYDIRKRY